MGQSPAGTKDGSERWAWLILLFAVLLWLTMRLEPQFYSNQNTKFLHGLADAGIGYLSEDWMAGTVDGLPLFSALVRWTAEVSPLWFFYVEHFLTFVVYAAALLLIFRREYPAARNDGWRATLLFLLIFAPFHVDQPIVGGVADQVMFNPMFEPANFGVFVLLGVWAFLAGRPFLAAVLVNLAAAVHAGYVAPGGFILLGMVACLPLWPRASRPGAAVALLLGLAALALNALLLKLAFPATTPELQAEATALITEERIPQHSDPLQWFDWGDAAKTALMLTAAILARNRWLARILAVALAGAAFSVLLVLVAELNLVRLIAPWRVSVFLMPLAWLVLISRAIELLLPLARRLRCAPLVLPAAALAACALAGLGTWVKVERFSEPRPAYVALVKARLGPGQIYLTDPRIERFRLATGAPQYINFKTHPYLDVEVLEWHRRLQIAQALYDAETMDCVALAALKEEEGVTHTLLRAGDPIMDCGFARLVGEDGNTKLYALNGGS